jgi:hypothetical protein
MTPLDMQALLDINDNGRVAWPDFLGWTVVTSLGLFGAAVILFVIYTLFSGAVRAIVPSSGDRSGNRGASAPRSLLRRE